MLIFYVIARNGFSTLLNKTIKYCFVREGAVSQSDPARKVEQNYVFACGAGAKCEAVALSAHAPNNPRQRSDVAIHKSTVLCV